MSLAQAPSSELSRLLRVMLDGDLSAARGVMDELQEQSRLDDFSWLRERIGLLAVSNFGTFIGDETTDNRRKKFLAEVGENHAISEKSWQSFASDVAARFWFDLYDLDDTLAALSESWKRIRPFGFPVG